MYRIFASWSCAKIQYQHLAVDFSQAQHGKIEEFREMLEATSVAKSTKLRSTSTVACTRHLPEISLVLRSFDLSVRSRRPQEGAAQTSPEAPAQQELQLRGSGEEPRTAANDWPPEGGQLRTTVHGFVHVVLIARSSDGIVIRVISDK